MFCALRVQNLQIHSNKKSKFTFLRRVILKIGSKSSFFRGAGIIILLLTVLMAGCSKVDSKISREESNKQVIVAATRVTASGLGQALKGIEGQSQRTDFVRQYVNAIRFMGDDSGYFFVYDYNCKNIAIAVFSDLQGKDLVDLKDSHGKYFIRDFVEMAKKGGGFVEYYWPHTVTKVDMRKIAYIIPIPGTEYLIGSGYYPDAAPEIK
jgi:signal transduction histidine kinase